MEMAIGGNSVNSKAAIEYQMSGEPSSSEEEEEEEEEEEQTTIHSHIHLRTN
ncbi:MAG: hypothetical protein ACK5IQ_01935 [Bacteroidales bacterium]